MLGSGQLCDVGVSTGVAGDELTWVTCAPLGPDRCPSALDPCGDAAPFGARLDPAVGYWVSTDGRWALTGAGEILEPTTEAPVRSDAPEGPHVGVLFFGDASVLAEALARDAEEAPASADEEEPVYCDEALTCRGGLRCDPQTVTCVPPCASDSDCATRGLCGATCTDGLCGPAPDGSCDEDERCPQGYECADGRCVQCQHDGDCTDGRVCERGACDPPECAADDDCDAGERCAAGRCAPACDASRSASDLGNDCALRMREGAWAEARQLCECALASSPSPRTEGALRYNLGRIAEEQGDRAEAIRQYRRSLEVRPGNAAVRSRLDALAP